MKRTTIENLISGLREFSDADFTCQGVYEFLGSHPVDVATIERFFFWSNESYTRNLIYKNERFELMAICWDKGQASRIHNHAGQKCWMTVPVGRLRGQNFGVSEIDESRGHCKLFETAQFDLSDCLAAKVELEEPIHQIFNLPEFNERAVSVHIYSKPFDTCLSYCTDTDTFTEVPLFYTTIDGRPCERPPLDAS